MSGKRQSASGPDGQKISSMTLRVMRLLSNFILGLVLLTPCREPWFTFLQE